MDKDKKVLEVIQLVIAKAMLNHDEGAWADMCISVLSYELPAPVAVEIREAIKIGLPSVQFIVSRWLHKIEKGVYNYG